MSLNFVKVEDPMPMVIDIEMPDSKVSIIDISELWDSGVDDEVILDKFGLSEEQLDHAKQYIDNNRDVVEDIRGQREKYEEMIN